MGSLPGRDSEGDMGLREDIFRMREITHFSMLTGMAQSIGSIYWCWKESRRDGGGAATQPGAVLAEHDVPPREARGGRWVRQAETQAGQIL